MERSTGALCQSKATMKTTRNKRWFLVSYDVRDPKRLRRVARHIEGYGVRLQYSLFRCYLSKREVERMRWELARILAQDDSILIIGLCPSCAKRVRERNKGALPHEDETFEII